MMHVGQSDNMKPKKKCNVDQTQTQTQPNNICIDSTYDAASRNFPATTALMFLPLFSLI